MIFRIQRRAYKNWDASRETLKPIFEHFPATGGDDDPPAKNYKLEVNRDTLSHMPPTTPKLWCFFT